MNYTNKILEQLKNNNGIVTTKWISENNIPKVYLTRMVKDKLIFRVGRGIYMDISGDYDELYFLQYQKPRLIYSYTTSLFLHEIVYLIPSIWECTVYSGYNIGNIPLNVQVHYIKKELYEFEIEDIKTKYGNKVKTYSLEKTICDIIANKEKVDSEVFGKSIRNYINSDKRDLNKLFFVADKMNIKEKVQDIMEIIYE